MILLALGTNVGDREENLRNACKSLVDLGVTIVKRSSIIETPALLLPEAPEAWNMPFLNQVLVVTTNHTPDGLLACAKSIERAMGRVDRGRWGPREIDIDVLAYHAEQRSTATLNLPHPAIAERDFVLRPLAEVAPEWRHPVTGLSAREMLG